MAEEWFRQASFNGGEIDPQIGSRDDLKAYFKSLASCANMLPLAQGPVVRRPGLAFIHQLRNPLVALDLSAATPTAENGGTAANLLDGAAVELVTTAAMGTTDPYVICEIDFGATVQLHAVDLVDFAAVAGGTAEGDDPPGEPQLGGDDGPGGGPGGDGSGEHLP